MQYLRVTKRMFDLLGVRFREAFFIVVLLTTYAALEGVGIGLLLPVLQYLETGGEQLPADGIWPYLTSFAESLGIPLNLGTLLLFALTPILLRQAVYYVNVWYAAAVQNGAVERLTMRSFGALAHADLAYIDSEDTGHLLGLVTGQVSRCGETLNAYLRAATSVLIMVIYGALLVLISWQLAVIALLALAVVSVAIKRIMVASREHGELLTVATQALWSAVRERLYALRLVKMRAQEDVEAASVRELAAELRLANTRIAVGAARVEVIVDPALMLVVFLILWFGFSVYGLTLASLGLFMFILLRTNSKAKDFNLGRQNIAAMLPSFDYVESMLEHAEGAPTPRGGTRPYTGLKESIEYRDVRFAYASNPEEVLKGVSLTIPCRSTTALVGRSGSGKSTLVDMLPLLRKPTSGAVLLDGVDVSEFDIATLRRSIGLLTQEPILFNDSIYNNLVYGLEEVPSDERIREVLDESYCSEFVSALPEGLETRIGDRGTRFSGGQRQRLALARVLLQDPDILILDEPTSALDSESEHYIQQVFERLARERTVLVIAHRLATVRRADQIVVIADGVVAECGKHDELLAREGGQYRRLFELQVLS